MTVTLLKQKNEIVMLVLSNGKRVISKSINEKSVHNLILMLSAINERERGIRYPVPSSLAEFPMENSVIASNNSFPNLTEFLVNSYSINAKQLLEECRLLASSSSVSKELASVVRMIGRGSRIVFNDFVKVEVSGRGVMRGDGVLLILCG